jgi:hypothetical protein
MPTMISSAVMTCSFSVPERLSVSSPFEASGRAIGRQAHGTLYLSESVCEVGQQGRRLLSSLPLIDFVT